MAKINLKKVERSIKAEFSNITFDTHYEKTSLNLTASLVAERYFDDGIYLSFFASENGYSVIRFTFDKIDINLSSYNLINEFNSNTVFKGYIVNINGSDYFQVMAQSFDINDLSGVLSFFSFYMNELLDDDATKYLKPITRITYE